MFFYAFMLKKADFDGYYDIPYIPSNDYNIVIKKLISYDKTKNYHYDAGDVVHFYIDDFKFDGQYGLWSLISCEKKNKILIDRFSGASAIIAPDYSLSNDMSRIMQIWNIYRSRAIGYYLASLGFNVIPNVRWTDKESYDFAFKGIKENQMVSVGTLGCTHLKKDRELLLNGFCEMLKRLKPKTVLIYGNICAELQQIIEVNKVDVIHFDSDISKYYRGITHGNEE